MALMSALINGIYATEFTGSVTIIKTLIIAQLMAMHTDNAMLVRLLGTVLLVHGIHATFIISSVTIIKIGTIVQYIVITEESLRNQWKIH